MRREQVVVGDPVGAACEHRLAVDHAGRTRSRTRRGWCRARPCAARSAGASCRGARRRRPARRRSSYSGCSPCPTGHQSVGVGDRHAEHGRRHTGVRASPVTTGVAARGRGRRGSPSVLEAERSTSTCTRDGGVRSGDGDERAAPTARRAVRQRWMLAGFQRPAVCRSGPQSQPKLQAILRTMFSGAGYAPGRRADAQRLLLGVRERAGEVDGERLGRAVGQGADVEPVAAVHVRGAGDLDAAQRDRRDRVQTLEDEVHALVVGRPARASADARTASPRGASTRARPRPGRRTGRRSGRRRAGRCARCRAPARGRPGRRCSRARGRPWRAASSPGRGSR